MTRARTTWILWFVFLAIPGSGFLRFDGIPFSSKLEFFAVAISTIALLSPGFREKTRHLLASHGGNSNRWVTLALVSVILLKFFTYTLLPLGNGFEACYRSIYAPLERANACEKSYEAPFLANDGINALGDITRMESAINFGKTIDYEYVGASGTTWKLPFANDFPRLGAQWLDRLPFTAKFGAKIDASADSTMPIQFVGEISIAVGGRKYSATSYEYSALVLVPVQKGRHELRIEYKFADIDSPEIPDKAPPARGPWAQLVVGSLLPADSALPHLTLNVRGWAINQKFKQSPLRVEIRSNSGEVLSSEQTFARPDVASAFKDKRYTKSGFTISVADMDTANKHRYYNVFAIYASGREDYVGLIESFSQGRTDTGSRLGLNSAHIMSPGVDFQARYSIESNDLSPLVPKPYIAPSGVQVVMFNLIDLLVLFATIGIAVLALIGLRGRILKLAALSLWFVICRWVVSYFNLSILDSQALVVALLVAIGLLVSLWRWRSLDLIGALAGATVVAIDPILRLLGKFGGLGSAPWWGFPIWRGRDGDWFVYQGYARNIFVEQSLRGGEALFYFQPGTRYFVFIQHLLFGENDVLLAILMIVSVLVAGVFVGREALKLSPKKSTFVGVAVFVSACFVLFSQFDLVGFAVNTASEYPTWILTIVVFGFMLRGAFSPRLAVALTIAAGLNAQFRPNQVFGACVLFLLIQFELAPGRGVGQLLTRLRLILVFGTVLSLSLLHNLYYASSFTVFSAAGSINSDFAFTSLIRIFNDEDVREIVFGKLRLALYWTTQPQHWEIAISFWSLQILWLLAVIKAIGSKCTRPRVWFALIFPLTYLIPLLPYRFGSYYPRHIVIIQLAFGLSALYAICKCGPSRRSEVNVNKFDVVIGANYYFPHVSGLSEAARLLAERLAADGLRVRVVCCRHQRDLPAFEVIGGVEVERVSVLAMIRNGPFSPLFPFRLARRARQARVVNMHLPMLESGLVSLLAGGTTSVVTYQCDFVGPRSFIGRIIERTMDFSNRIAIGRATRVVVSSRDYAVQSRLAKYLVNATPIAPPFVNRARGVPTFRRSDGFHYGFLGRMTVEKGLVYLIRAFQQCAQPNDQLLIGGENSKKLGESVINEVQALIAGDPRISILGFIEEERMSDFYASLDAFVFPSINSLEAFGIVQMEALSAGVPVVASNIPGVRTIVLETGCGLLAEMGDVSDLARAMNEIRHFEMPTTIPATTGTSLDVYVDLFRTI